MNLLTRHGWKILGKLVRTTLLLFMASGLLASLVNYVDCFLMVFLLFIVIAGSPGSLLDTLTITLDCSIICWSVGWSLFSSWSTSLSIFHPYFHCAFHSLILHCPIYLFIWGKTLINNLFVWDTGTALVIYLVLCFYSCYCCVSMWRTINLLSPKAPVLSLQGLMCAKCQRFFVLIIIEGCIWL